MKPRFFAAPEEFRAWLVKHHESKSELLVGFRKTHTGQPSITWPQSVDEALCAGWIDGVRKRVDDETYTIRFTPRKKTSTWSAVNVKRVAELTREGRMLPAGLRAFEARRENKTGIYAYENRPEAFPPEIEKRFRANKLAWTWWQAQAAWYRTSTIWWVISAKREETRERRLAELMSDSAEGRTIKRLTRAAA